MQIVGPKALKAAILNRLEKLVQARRQSSARLKITVGSGPERQRGLFAHNRFQTKMDADDMPDQVDLANDPLKVRVRRLTINLRKVVGRQDVNSQGNHDKLSTGRRLGRVGGKTRRSEQRE